MLLFGDLFGQVTEEIPIGKSRSRRDRIDRANWNLSRYTSRSLESSSQTAAIFSCARLKENRKSWKAQEIFFDWLCFQITGYTDVDAPLILRYTKKKIIPTTTIKKQEKQINKEAIHWRASERTKRKTIDNCHIANIFCFFVDHNATAAADSSCESFFTCCCSPLSCSHCYYLLLFHVYSPPTIFGATAV